MTRFGPIIDALAVLGLVGAAVIVIAIAWRNGPRPLPKVRFSERPAGQVDVSAAFLITERNLEQDPASTYAVLIRAAHRSGFADVRAKPTTEVVVTDVEALVAELETRLHLNETGRHL